MKAMILNEYGDNAEFNLTELSQPSVKAGLVVVRVAATSVNTVDTMIRQMGNDLPLSPDLPAVLGMDFAGTIEAVGEGGSDFTPGDEVYGCAGGLADLQGTLAEYMPASANGPKVAYLWGNLQDGQSYGTLVKLPAGFTGEIRSHGSTFRAVVIKGQSHYQVSESDVKPLEPGSYFSSQGALLHQVSSNAGVESIIYIRTDGKYDVISARPRK